jgi:hypothetical protein
LTRRNKRPFSPINCYISSPWYILPRCEVSYRYNEMSVFAQTVRFCPFGIFYLTATFFLSVTIDPDWTSGLQWDCMLFTRLNFQIVEKIFSQSTRAEWNDFCFFKKINWCYNISNFIRKNKTALYVRLRVKRFACTNIRRGGHYRQNFSHTKCFGLRKKYWNTD